MSCIKYFSEVIAFSGGYILNQSQLFL